MKRSWIRRHWFISALLLLLLIPLSWAWGKREAIVEFPGVVSAFTAKEYCSCRYVMGNPAEYCRSYIKQMLPLSDFLDAPEHKRVTAAVLGSANTAAWMGEREGCRLLP